LLEQHASMSRLGWNTIYVIKAFEVPLLSVWSVSPVVELNTFSLVPLIDAVAIKVPHAFTAI
jgi:hypothetical protein